MNRNSIDGTFGVKRNGMKHRAKTSYHRGHINMTTMKCASVKNKKTKAKILVLMATNTPSYKDGEYSKLLMVEENGKYLGCPYSGCDCPVGQLYCRHMLPLLIYVIFLQIDRDCNYEIRVKIIPEPILS